MLKMQMHTTWTVHHLLGSEGERQPARESVCYHHTQPCKPTASSVPLRETRMCVASSADVVTRFTLVRCHLVSDPLLKLKCLACDLTMLLALRKEVCFLLPVLCLVPSLSPTEGWSLCHRGPNLSDLDFPSA